MISSEYSSLLATFLIGSVLLLVAFFLRFLPHVLAPLGIGVDHWYWKQYIEKYRKERKFPPELPQYLLESDQWYPPFFPLLLAFLPQALFDRFSHILAILIDLIRMVGLMAIVYYLSRDATAVAIAGAVYAVTPLLISYNVQLNPRGLGATMLDLVVTVVLFSFYFNGPVWLWFLLIPFSGLLLLTHKMNTQLFWFLCLVGSVILDWRLVTLIPMSIFAALIVSKGFYWKVLLHHYDVVSFWYRNWRWLGANPIKESPIYGNSTYETPRKLHRKGFIGIIKHLYSQLGYNPFAWLMVVILPLYPILPIPPGGFLHFVVGWLGLTLIFALATSIVPSWRCLGAGHLYLYNAAFPASLLWGLLSFYWKHEYFTIFLIIGTVGSVLGILRFCLHVKKSETLKIDLDFELALVFLSSQLKGAVMCCPPQWYDLIAYKTGFPVLYGGHGFGFKMLQDTFPRLLVPVSELIRRYSMRYVVILTEAVNDKFLADIPAHIAHDFGKYRVISLDVPGK